MGLKDGIPSLEINSATVSGNNALFTNVSGTELILTAEISDAQVTNAKLAVQAVSGNRIFSGTVALSHMAIAAVSGGHLVSGGVNSAHYLDASVLNAALGNNAASGIKVSSEFGPVKTGSPSVGGLSMQAGSATLSTGSLSWVVFGTAFADIPRVVVGNVTTLGAVCVSGTISAGSFVSIGATASDTFNWYAIGSGRV